MRDRQIVHAAPPFQSIHAIEKSLLTFIIASTLVASSAVFYFDAEQIALLTSESGPFEIMAALLWFVLAVVCMRNLGLATRYTTELALLCVLFGARELDLHKRITSASIFKLNYYRITDAPLIEKLAAALVAAAIFWLIGRLVQGALRYFFREKAWRWIWGRLVILASGLLVLAVIFDRTARVLKEDFGITISETARQLLSVHEEWFESLAPIIFGLAVLFWCRMNKPDAHTNPPKKRNRKIDGFFHLARGAAGVSNGMVKQGIRGALPRLRNGIALQGNAPFIRLRNDILLQEDMRPAREAGVSDRMRSASVTVRACKRRRALQGRGGAIASYGNDEQHVRK